MKKTMNIIRLERLIKILNILKEREVSCYDLSKRFSISTRQMKRDIKLLREIGANIITKTIKGRNKIYILKNYKQIIRKLNKIYNPFMKKGGV